MILQNHQQLRSIFTNGLLLSLFLLFFTPASAVVLEITFELPEIETSTYNRPFVAIWLETKKPDNAYQTIAVWYDDRKWLKDIRKWWRKVGRYQDSLDGFSGATKPSGSYTLTTQLDVAIDAADTEYTLYLEAVREHGNRSLFKQKIKLSKTFPQIFVINKGQEIGPGLITIKELD
jgi:hypothetical protein